jgi:hypothetical protein
MEARLCGQQDIGRAEVFQIVQPKPSALKREHPALQNMKFLNFLWVIFVLLDPDPDSESGPIRIRNTG